MIPMATLFVGSDTPEHSRSDGGPNVTAKAVRDRRDRIGANPLFIEPGQPAGVWLRRQTTRGRGSYRHATSRSTGRRRPASPPAVLAVPHCVRDLIPFDHRLCRAVLVVSNRALLGMLRRRVLRLLWSSSWLTWSSWCSRDSFWAPSCNGLDRGPATETGSRGCLRPHVVRHLEFLQEACPLRAVHVPIMPRPLGLRARHGELQDA